MSTLGALASAVGLVMALGPTLVGCGYRSLAAAPPFGIERLAVVPFAEPEPVGLAADLAEAISRELGTTGVRLVGTREGADAVLRGSVVSAQTVPGPVSSARSAVRSYEVVVTVVAVLERGGKELWRATLTARDGFVPAMSDDAALASARILESEANRRAALRRTAAELARSLHDQLVVAGLPPAR